MFALGEAMGVSTVSMPTVASAAWKLELCIRAVREAGRP